MKTGFGLTVVALVASDEPFAPQPMQLGLEPPLAGSVCYLQSLR